MVLGQQLSDSVGSIVQMFGLCPTETIYNTNNSLVSYNNVNILVGFAGGARGNAYLGMPYETAYLLATHMLGSKPTELDAMVASALSELGNMVFGTVLNKLESNMAIILSPPTLVHGREMTLLISRAKATLVKLKIDGLELTVAMTVE